MKPLINWFVQNRQEILISLLIFLCAIGLRFFWIHWVPTTPNSDFEVCFSAAQEMLNGTFNYAKEPYFDYYGYQLGFAYEQFLIMKIFGGGLWTIKVFNVFLNGLTAVIIYLFSRRFTRQPFAIFGALVYCFSPTAISYSSVLTNQHVSMLSLSLGLYLVAVLLKKPKWFLIIPALTLALGAFARPNLQPFLLAILLWGLYSVIRTKKWKLLGTATILICITWGAFKLESKSAHAFSPKITNPMVNKAMLQKIYFGLNPESKGHLTKEDAQILSSCIVDNRLDEEKFKPIGLAKIKERLADPLQVAQLFYDKTMVLLFSFDRVFWAYKCKSVQKEDYPHSLFYDTESVIYFVTLPLFFIGLFYSLKGTSGEAQNISLVAISLIVYLGIHLIIEYQHRYKLDVFPLACVMISFGTHALRNKLKKLMDQKST